MKMEFTITCHGFYCWMLILFLKTIENWNQVGGQYTIPKMEVRNSIIL